MLCAPTEELRGLAVADTSPQLSEQHDTALVIVSRDLSLEAVRKVISTRAVALLSSHGNFVAHGVNLLRAHVRRSGIPITVAVGLPSLPVEGTEVTISTSGVVAGTFETPRDPSLDKSVRTHVRIFRGSRQVTGTCYWPHRKYDRLTSSLMVPGLQTDASDLAGSAVAVELSTSGHIWFGEGAPTSSKLTLMALDRSLGAARLARQQELYRIVLESVRDLRESSMSSPARLSALGALVSQYFSAFLLYHDDYDRVLFHLLGDEELQRDLVLRSALTDWILDTPVSLPLRKDLLEAGEPLPLPHPAVIDDLGTARNIRNAQEFAHAILVTKEWKFFINKLLFRDFSIAARLLVSASDLPALRSRPFEDLLAHRASGR